MNRLAAEKSPYLLQHKDNPVHWYPWGEAAFAAALSENKPVFLSIGYSTCHWCHVMEHDSFDRADVAEVLNENFICIKVDREERPDIDLIYMEAVVAMTGQGGWPLSVFLTPDKKPFFGGTFFPRPQFLHLLDAERTGGRLERFRLWRRWWFRLLFGLSRRRFCWCRLLRPRLTLCRRIKRKAHYQKN